MSTVSIRKMVKDDFKAILELDHQIFSDEKPFTLNDLARYFEGKYSFVAVDTEKNIIGYLFMRKQLNENNPSFFIGNFAVDAKYRGQGIGSDLMNQAFSVIENEIENTALIDLQVSKSNEKAIAIYTHKGFQQVNSYPDNFIMRKTLPPVSNKSISSCLADSFTQHNEPATQTLFPKELNQKSDFFKPTPVKYGLTLGLTAASAAAVVAILAGTAMITMNPIALGITLGILSLVAVGSLIYAGVNYYQDNKSELAMA